MVNFCKLTRARAYVCVYTKKKKLNLQHYMVYCMFKYYSNKIVKQEGDVAQW